MIHRRLLSGTIAVLVAGLATLAAVAKGEDFLPLTIHLIGAGGDRSFAVAPGPDSQDLGAFIYDQVGGALAASSGAPPGLPAPSLTDFYEIVFIQAPTAYRLPWYGMPTAQFFYYPARGSLQAYVRLHVARISEPVQDVWLIAGPSLTNLVERHRDGLQPIHPQPQPAPGLPAWSWLGLIPLLAGGILVFLRRWPGRTLVSDALKGRGGELSGQLREEA